jgi:tRNA pseudouridine32 synthase / 23S rRNA pseudouridine746 synthase
MTEKITLLQQTAEWILVDKPYGYLSVPGRNVKGAQKDERPVLGLILENQLGTRVWPVHRLDFEVSGIMIFALNEKSHRELNRLFETRQVKKIYEALTENKNSVTDLAKEITWNSKLVRGKKRTFEADHGDIAITHAKLIQNDLDLCFWRLQPETGRSHQLRVHLSKNGFPILGDLLYGGRNPKDSDKTILGKSEIALRAVSLEFSGQTFGAPSRLNHWMTPRVIPNQSQANNNT